jgi:hypothetical protein
MARYTAGMRRVAWIALVGLLLQPVAATVCETRCFASPEASTVPADSSCHEASTAPAGTLTITAAPDSCAHADLTEPTSAPLPRASLAILPSHDARATRVVPRATRAAARLPNLPRHRAPDDSSGTLRV